MAHFAKVVNNIVVEVIVADQAFIDTLPTEGNIRWIQTSYNTRGGRHFDPETGNYDDTSGLRKNYAGVGYRYDDNLDAFIPPNPYPSWSLNLESCLYEPPTPIPSDGGLYSWDEDTLTWEKIN